MAESSVTVLLAISTVTVSARGGSAGLTAVKGEVVVDGVVRVSPSVGAFILSGGSGEKDSGELHLLLLGSLIELSKPRSFTKTKFYICFMLAGSLKIFSILLREQTLLSFLPIDGTGFVIRQRSALFLDRCQ